MRNHFDEQLNELRHKLTHMGALCEEAIALAARALMEANAAVGRRALTLDAEIDQMEREIEGLCLKLLLQQQPVARDLRQISAALKMITDMERIGDQASDIVEIIPYLKERRVRECDSIRQMAAAAIKMVVESVDAFVRRDLKLARHVIQCDDIVDALFDSTRSALIRMIAENHADGEYALDLLMIAKYFERIGDHATNIAEWVEFSVTGIHRGGQG
ncbi:phosphate transport system protein [Fusobacterium naviforme]|uniref:Phosphate-specific transport system accessory protein PhoU n=1 Tax=Moryella indoligenes TaxID=371674 RepID=A0AAE3V8Y7_9FIRM|nr:phosphate signaling complex protein PhoU [Moryella indoligenes]KAB0578795.1 phosphate signaling complex protein PhoU [Fusobacterium naviforme]MDQ0151949.1 phosphate transport system protein [Moryella indoligenes]PSL11568.1 phosphate transport system protein [Fusobacterium naviforme]STO26650.1 Phosphate transport system protein phoU homolog [Fusobacterium naviforme]